MEKCGINNTIWLFWDNYPGKQMPEYIKLCWKTIYKHCGNDFNIVIVNSDNIKDYLPNLRKDWFMMTQLNQKANYARYKLLHQYGGIWLDSDVIMLKSLKPLMDQVLNSELDLIATASPEYGYGEPENGLIVSEARGKVVTRALEITDNLMDKSKTKQFTWGFLGVQALRTAVKDLSYIHLPSSQLMPVSWKAAWRFWSGESIESLCDDSTYGFMLFNEMFRRANSKILTMNQEELMTTKILIGQIFRKSLN